jgi:mono/diheme cytochrome c family protein
VRSVNRPKPTWTVRVVTCALLAATLAVRMAASGQGPAPVDPAARAADAAPDAASTRAVLDRYCVTCHSDRLKTAGLSLQGRVPTTWLPMPGSGRKFCENWTRA